MALNTRLNRRTFLRSAGATAVLGAVGRVAAGSPTSSAVEQANGAFDFDTPFNRRGTDSSKWDRPEQQYGKGSIDVGMGIADMDFKAAPSITKALQDRLQHENWGYLTIPRGFAEDVAAWNQRRHGLAIDPDTIEITTGVHPAIIAGLRAFSPRGSKVLMVTPIYSGFYSDIRAVENTPEESPMRLVEGRYTIDFEDLERRIGPDTHVMIFCNPQNPTGNVWSPEDLMRIGELCLRRRVVVFADEIHCDFVTPGHKYTPFASLPNKDVVNNSITFKAASKTFNLSAMKAAWYFSTNKEYMARVKFHSQGNEVNTLGMIAARGAYTGGEEWLNQLLPYIDGNLTYAAKFIADKIPSIKVVKPQGTYLMWLDVSAAMEKAGIKDLAAEMSKTTGRVVTPAQAFESYMVKNSRVFLNPGSGFGRGGEARMRMNIATSRSTLELALNNMAKALNGARLSNP